MKDVELFEQSWHVRYNKSVRLVNVLKNLDINSLEELKVFGIDKLKKQRNVGARTIEEATHFLEQNKKIEST